MGQPCTVEQAPVEKERISTPVHGRVKTQVVQERHQHSIGLHKKTARASVHGTPEEQPAKLQTRGPGKAAKQPSRQSPVPDMGRAYLAPKDDADYDRSGSTSTMCPSSAGSSSDSFEYRVGSTSYGKGTQERCASRGSSDSSEHHGRYESYGRSESHGKGTQDRRSSRCRGTHKRSASRASDSSEYSGRPESYGQGTQERCASRHVRTQDRTAIRGSRAQDTPLHRASGRTGTQEKGPNRDGDVQDKTSSRASSTEGRPLRRAGLVQDRTSSRSGHTKDGSASGTGCRVAHDRDQSSKQGQSDCSSGVFSKRIHSPRASSSFKLKQDKSPKASSKKTDTSLAFSGSHSPPLPPPAWPPEAELKEWC